MGFFVAGEGRRLYGRTTTSATPNRTVMTMRRPVAVAGLIVSFNTPLPNYAWKAFPAVFCGNTAVLKPSEHTPISAAFFGELCNGLLPPGVLNVVHGLGPEAGPPLVDSPCRSRQLHGLRGDGRWISTRRAQAGEGRASSSAARTRWLCATTPISEGRSSGRSLRRSRTQGSAVRRRAVSSCSTRSTTSFANGSWRARARYETGPVISEASLERFWRARRSEGGGRRRAPDRPGWWLAPTVVEDVVAGCGAFRTELFGPVAILYRVAGLEEAIALVNDSPYGLTSAIHTASLHRAMRFADEVEAGSSS